MIAVFLKAIHGETPFLPTAPMGLLAALYSSLKVALSVNKFFFYYTASSSICQVLLVVISNEAEQSVFKCIWCSIDTLHTVCYMKYKNKYVVLSLEFL